MLMQFAQKTSDLSPKKALNVLAEYDDAFQTPDAMLKNYVGIFAVRTQASSTLMLPSV